MKTDTRGFVTAAVLIALLVISGAIIWFLKPTVQRIPDSRLKTFSSKNYPGQFNFFQFQYPESWNAYYVVYNDQMYIVKQDGPMKIISSQADIKNIKNIANTYIQLRLGSDQYTEENVKKYLFAESAKATTIDGKKVLIWISPDSLEDAERNQIKEYSLNYTIYTTYTNKKSVTFMLKYKVDQEPKKEDIDAMETMVRTFTVDETPAPKK